MSQQNHEARELALKFLYQCETDRMFYFSQGHFRDFARYLDKTGGVVERAGVLCEIVFASQNEIDKQIESVAEHWPLHRMAITDRLTLRLAAAEILEDKTPVKVILNEAIELAKRYGTQNSARFVNGLLDSMVKDKLEN
ncbi:MAG: transcription antitermination factor NusB [Oligoflexales bacterium]